jgi:benzoylsuccinyl-CoA thiolase BbsB subunit
MLGRTVYVSGVGMTRFGKHRARSIEDLGREAVLAAMADAGIGAEAIQEAYCGSYMGGPLIGQRILRDLGMTGMPIVNVENACSSSATGLREAVTAIAAERADTILVIGVDKLTRLGGGAIPLDETDIEASQGMTLPALYAMRARRYLIDTGGTVNHLAKVAVKAHANGARNPYAQFQNVISIKDVEKSRMVADPLRLYMCCPTGDGGSAAIVTSRKPDGSRAIRVAASALQSGEFKTGYREMAFSDLTARTAAIAYEQAGIGPEDLDVSEVHDAFAIAELMYYEALGLCAPGEALRLIDNRVTAIDGARPVNTSGGLLCRGHPPGATGLAQVCEAIWQLRGVAGARQVKDPKVALTHCTGGGISGLDHGACAIHIFQS